MPISSCLSPASKIDVLVLGFLKALIKSETRDKYSFVDFLGAPTKTTSFTFSPSSELKSILSFKSPTATTICFMFSHLA